MLLHPKVPLRVVALGTHPISLLATTYSWICPLGMRGIYHKDIAYLAPNICLIVSSLMISWDIPALGFDDDGIHAKKISGSAITDISPESNGPGRKGPHK